MPAARVFLDTGHDLGDAAVEGDMLLGVMGMVVMVHITGLDTPVEDM